MCDPLLPMKIFISYAHKDIKLVKRLIPILQQAGHDVWYDSALKAGQSWQQQLEDEIANCDVFVYVMTPNSAWDVSEWCHWEFVTAVEQHKPVLPLLAKSMKLPVVISRLQYADLTKGFRKNVIAKLLSDLEALRVLDTRDLPPKPDRLPENPEREIVIEQTITASGNARINNVGQQNYQTQTTITNSNSVVLGLIVTLIIAVIGFVIVIIVPNLTQTNAQAVTATDAPTATESSTNTPIATPATPFVMSDEETAIRTGPGVRFEMLTMWDGRALDILGRSADGGWYQVRLRDGSVGWVVNSQTVVDVSGNLGIIPTIVITHTPTDLPTDTPAPTLTDTRTYTPTLTLSPTPTYTPSPTLTPSHTPEPSNTPAIPPTATATQTPSQCTGKIPGAGGMINQVKVLPNPSSPARAPVQRGAVVVILDMVSDFGTTWYQIQYADNSGWISEDYVDVPMNCS